VVRGGTPASIAELSRHDCLVLRDRNQAFGVWQLSGPNGIEKIKVTGRLSSNNAEIVRGWANDGHGILLPSRWDVHADLLAGRLVEILAALRQASAKLQAVLPLVDREVDDLVADLEGLRRAARRRKRP
jgi:LysR family transcriptional regulator, transcriptional activator for dmlA